MMAEQCHEWHCLPYEGGLYDQDPLHVSVMSAFSAAIAEKQNRENKKKPGKH